MKVLKILLGVLVLLVVGFLAIGLFGGDVTYENHVDIERPADQVWDVFTDVDRMDRWLGDLKSIEALDGETLQPGSRWRLTFLEGEQEIEILETVTRAEPRKAYAFDLDTEPFTGTTEVLFHDHGDHTEMDVTTTIKGRNVLWRSMMQFTKSMMQSRSQESYERLKSLVEAS